MRMSLLLPTVLLMLLVACSSKDPLEEVNALVASGDIVAAKKKYQELVEAENNPNIEREYIKFLYEQKQYQDFKRNVGDYLARYPEDLEIMELNFDYFAMLATDAERQGDYEAALDYIVTKLLSSDYKDFRKWETKQSTVLKKWYTEAEENEDPLAMREALIKMRNLGFENLARSLAPEIYNEIEAAAGEAAEEGDQ